MSTLIADIEADNLLHDVSTIWVIVTKDVETGEVRVYSSEQGNIMEGVAALAAADRLVMHNGLGYDVHAVRLVTGVRLDPSKVIDTMVVGRLRDPERVGGHSLASYGEEFGMPKGDHSDFSQWSPEMETYCIRDVEITEKIYRKHYPVVSQWGGSCELEHQVAWIISLQILNGIGFNVPHAEALAQKLYAERAELHEKLVETFGWWYKPTKPFVPKRDNKKSGYVAGSAFCKLEVVTFNPGSRQHIAERLMKTRGWKPKDFTDNGQPRVDDEVMATLPYPEAPLLTRYLRLTKMLGQLAEPPKGTGSGGGWLHRVRNGRIHGGVNTNGAVTGRMTHFAPNLAQVDKDHEMRACFGPRPGMKQTGCDAEGLELRMLGHYLAAWDNGAYSDAVVTGTKEAGTDAHTRTQKIVGLYRRDSAKTTIYALIYGGGDTKLGLIIRQDAVDAGMPKPKGKPSDIGKAARSKIETGIVGLDKLIAAVRKKTRINGFVKGLDGRHIFVRSEHSCLNTLLQGAGAILMKKALVLFHAAACERFGEPLVLNENATWGYMANVHDEVQLESHPDISTQLGQLFADCIRDAGAALKVRCPMSGAFDVGDNWAQTH